MLVLLRIGWKILTIPKDTSKYHTNRYKHNSIILGTKQVLLVSVYRTNRRIHKVIRLKQTYN